MKACLLLPALALLTAGPVRGEVEIKGETKVPLYRLVELRAAGYEAGAAFIWDVYPEQAVDMRETGDRILFVAPAGTYSIKLRVIRFKDGQTTADTARATVVIGAPGPTPPGPDPPDPKPPDPKPPDPTPADLPISGKSVLIVYETSRASSMPEKQQQVLYGKTVRDYLNAKCDQDGKVKSWRIYDADVDTSAESKVWQDAMKRKRGQLPWLVVGNGKTGYEGPLPATVEDTLVILRKYLGD